MEGDGNGKGENPTLRTTPLQAITVEPKIITRRHVDFRIKETKMPLRCIRIPTRERPIIIVGQVKGAHKR